MNLNELIQLYNSWQPYEDEPSQDLEGLSLAIKALGEQLTPEAMGFLWRIIHEFNADEDDAVWMIGALKAIAYCEDKELIQRACEYVISFYDQYKALGPGLNTPLYALGMNLPYPNAVLQRAIEYPDTSQDASERLAHRLFRASAYGAYIMSATDFQTGLEAGRAMKDSGAMPTLAQAEAFIARWQAQKLGSLPD